MTNGSVIMEGYTPEVDATIVTRILDAGTVIGVCISHNLVRAGYRPVFVLNQTKQGIYPAKKISKCQHLLAF